MKLEEMVQIVRETCQDVSYSGNAQTQLVTDEQIISFLNEGQVVACKASSLLKTSDIKVGEKTTKLKLSVKVAPTSTLNFINWGDNIILNEAVSYNVNPFLTASNIANKINTYQSTKDVNERFKATVSNENNNVFLIISAPAGSGSSMNEVYPNYSYTPDNVIMIDFVELVQGNHGICKLVYTKGDDILKFSKRIIRFNRYTDEKLNRLCAGHVDNGCYDILYGESTDYLRLGFKPKRDGYIIATVEYLPEVLVENEQEPDIDSSLHTYLIEYALYKILSISDIEAEQMSFAKFHIDNFTRQFGELHNTAANLKVDAFRFGGL